MGCSSNGTRPAGAYTIPARSHAAMRAAAGITDADSLHS
ncbi:hypothetical protein PS9374_05723 [Planomonospora sphaerica]|uniref:Uncharacterized protein n=1 Tax=Planomonospora sphaerica TaxID=161355 RepID=A0A161ME05_9ACTN|nr:hypothetical protein PS9374_05723 [Planomonospora sphaerica]